MRFQYYFYQDWLFFASLDPPHRFLEDHGPGYAKEVLITLLKAEPTPSRQNWWRAPLKGLETRGQPRPATQPADPEMVSKCCAFKTVDMKEVEEGRFRDVCA